MLEAKALHALVAGEVIRAAKLDSTVPRLADSRLTIFLSTLCVLLQLALTSLDVFVPEVRRSDSLLGKSLQSKGHSTERAYDHVVVISGLRITTAALVVLRPPMGGAEDFRAELTAKWKEVLLLAMGHRAVLSDVGKLHLK